MIVIDHPFGRSSSAQAIGHLVIIISSVWKKLSVWAIFHPVRSNTGLVDCCVKLIMEYILEPISSDN